jgi:hypothetical protein
MKKTEPNKPLTQGEIDALLNVLSGELRGAVLLSLLTRRPVREIVGWPWESVVPFIRDLADHFHGSCPSDPAAPLFPGLSKLPARFFDNSGGPATAQASIGHLVSQVLSTTPVSSGPKARPHRRKHSK